MDTSKQYIKMCDFTEIQEHRLHDGGGQFYAWRSPHFKKQVHVDSFPGGKGTSVWLPRQDQIQEMMGTDNKEPFCTWLERLKIFTHLAQPWDIPIDKNGLKTIDWFESWEQLWLAFYMWEKHKKTWGGKKWVKK